MQQVAASLPLCQNFTAPLAQSGILWNSLRDSCSPSDHTTPSPAAWVGQSLPDKGPVVKPCMLSSA